VNTVRNCWNHAKTLARPLTSGPVDSVIDELKDLLLQLAESGSEALDVEDILSRPSERWTANSVETDDEDAEFLAAYRARDESDEEEADDSESVRALTLREARAAGEQLKTFVQQN
jgi:hypothetical protein